MSHATGAMAVLAMCGPRAEEMAQKLALGLLAEWKQASLAQKRGIWNAARTMPMGHERQACLKFMRMVEDGERRGTI